MESPKESSTSPTASNGADKSNSTKKRKVTPEQEVIKKRPKVANDVEKADDSSNENYKVCEILIQNLEGGRGYADNNYKLSFLVGKHGLFDLVLKVFEIMHKEQLTGDDYYSHLWSITFDDKKYRYGWRDYPSKSKNRDTDHIDAQDIRPFRNLDLKVGRTGRFRGESAHFNFIVKKINGSPEKNAEYPMHFAIPMSFSSDLSDDWITESEKAACLQAKDDWRDYFSGEENSSKFDDDFEVVPCRPLPIKWHADEYEIMSLLINAGHKFAKSWNNILQYALVSRQRQATYCNWSKLDKEAYRRRFAGKGKSEAEMILLAKRLAKYRVENIPMPPTQEKILAERNKMIQDNMRYSQRNQIDN